jgi:hypothetical protein
MPNRQRFALRAQAAYYIGTGAWPLLSRRAFEAVTGHKHDWWLVQMVGLLAFTNGIAIGIGARSEYPSPEALSLSTLSALSFAAIDAVYAIRGRISPIYLADAVLELGFILAVVRR